MSGNFSTLVAILAIAFLFMAEIEAKELAPVHNPVAGSPNAFIINNPSYLVRASPNQHRTSDSVMLQVEGGVSIGYIGIDELNPYHLSSAYFGEAVGFGLSVRGLSHEKFTDLSISGAVGYSILSGFNIGASYSFDYFQARGYRLQEYHDIKLSAKVDIVKSFVAYVVLSDILDERGVNSVSRYARGRELVVGIIDIDESFAYGSDFMISESSFSINPFFQLALLDVMDVYVKGRSDMMSIVGGMVIKPNSDIYLGLDTLYSEQLGFDFNLTLGYRLAE